MSNSASLFRAVIIDDSAIIRKIAARMFRNLNFEAHEAASGDDGLLSIKQILPDVVLLDWNMPGKDGIEVLREINAMQLPRRPRIVFCTTESTADKIAMALGAGADEYIMKPFDEEILRLKLAEIGFNVPNGVDEEGPESQA